MSLADMHRRQLTRARESAASEQTTVAKCSSDIASKARELGRTKSDSRRASLTRQLEALEKKRAAAQTRLAKHMTEAARLERRVVDDDRRQARQLSAESRPFPPVVRQVAALIAADSVPREHDVYLCHASPDKDAARRLYEALAACGLDVWFDEVRLVLGESQSMQMDRGIARSKIGVVLVTPAFLEGRRWTERELGAMFSADKRVIPVAQGVDFEGMAKYSPLLADRAGLSIDADGMEGVALAVADALSS
jgi:hypothetical protein